jgi:hypothetical protein
MGRNLLIALGLLLGLTNSLYTSSYWTKKGIDVRDGVL